MEAFGLWGFFVFFAAKNNTWSKTKKLDIYSVAYKSPTDPKHNVFLI